jgi:hypothetical protein
VAGYLPTFARLTTRRTDLLARVHSNRVAHPPGCAIGVGPGVVPLAGGHYFTVLATSPVERTKQRSYRGTADPRRAAPCWDGSMSATTAISRRCRERLASRRSRIAVRYAARVAPGSRHSQLSSWVSSIHDVFHSVTDEVASRSTCSATSRKLRFTVVKLGGKHHQGLFAAYGAAP